MNATWINQIMSIQAVWAQTPPGNAPNPLTQPPVDPAPVSNFFQNLGIPLGQSLLNIVAAILILIVGWLVALVAASIVRGLLKRTNIDNRIAASITGRPATGRDAVPVEKWVANFVFWVVIIFTIVAVLNQLQLAAVSAPLTTFLNQILGFIPSLLGAAVLLAVAWGLATIVKMIVTRSLRTFGLDERVSDQIRESDPNDPDAYRTSNQLSLSDTIGNTLYWFIFLLFLPSILNTLGLQGTLQPVQRLLDNILAALPNILAAVLIGAAFWLVAQVVRRIVTNLLAASGADHLGSRFGISRTAGGQSLSWIVGTIVYVLILIPGAIAALQALQIQAISQPATAMLEQVLNALPLIVTAAFILIVAYFIGRFVSDLVTSILTSIGFNNIFNALGLPNLRRPSAMLPPAQPGTPPGAVTARTPSEIAGIITLVGIMLFATVAAVNILNIPALTVLVTGIVIVLGQVLAGLVVFAIGLYLGNLAFNLINSSGSPQARILAQLARVAIIVFVSAMALDRIGVASNIVNLAFGLLLGAIAVAIALAFGLGTRDIAANQVRNWLDSFNNQRNQPPRV